MMLANGQMIKELWHVPTGSLLSGSNSYKLFTAQEGLGRLVFSNDTAKYMLNIKNSYYYIYDLEKEQKIVKFDLNYPNNITIDNIRFLEYIESKNRLIIADRYNVLLVDCSTGETLINKRLPSAQDYDISYFYDKKGSFFGWIVNPPNSSAYIEFFKEDTFEAIKYQKTYKNSGTAVFAYIGDGRVIYKNQFILPTAEPSPIDYNVIGFVQSKYIYHGSGGNVFSVYDYSSLSKIFETTSTTNLYSANVQCSESGIVSQGYYGDCFEFFWFNNSLKTYESYKNRFLIGNRFILQDDEFFIIGTPKTLSMSTL